MRTNHFALLAVMGIAAAVLTGCAASAPGSVATEAAAPSASPTPTSTPSETATADPADPSTWIISDAGVGPIEVGGDFAATLTALPTEWTNDQQSCAWSAWWKSEDTSWGMYFVRGNESEGDPIKEISVYTASEVATDGPVTAEGLGVGATKEEILAAHPEAEEGVSEIGGGSWIRLPGDGDAHVFFDFREGETVANDVVVTTMSQPSYEVCG